MKLILLFYRPEASLMNEPLLTDQEAACWLPRANWNNNGMADGTQLTGEVLLAQTSPRYQNQTRRGWNSSQRYNKTTSLAWLCCHWPGCTGRWPFLGSCLHSELSSLGYAGAWPDFLAPTPEPGKPPFLYFLCPSPTLHSCGRVRLGRPPPATFPICCWPQPVPASSATPLPHLPWKGGTVQYLVGDGDAREGGVARQVEMWRGYKNQDGTSRQIFTTGQKLSFLNIQYFIFYNSNKKLKLTKF